MVANKRSSQREAHGRGKNVKHKHQVPMLLLAKKTGLYHSIQGCKKRVPVAMVSLIEDPKTYKEAVQSRNATLRRDAMRSKSDSLMAKGIWEVILKSPGHKLLHSKWVF